MDDVNKLAFVKDLDDYLGTAGEFNLALHSIFTVLALQ